MTIHGSCLSFPFRADNRGTLKTVGDRSALIEESIRSIIETRQGERVMMPDYGIPDLVFSVMDGGFASRIAYFIEQQILRYEPLVESVEAWAGSQRDGRFVSDLGMADSQRAAVMVEYRERGSSVPRNLVFPTWELLRSAT